MLQYGTKDWMRNQQALALEIKKHQDAEICTRIRPNLNLKLRAKTKPETAKTVMKTFALPDVSYFLHDSPLHLFMPTWVDSQHTSRSIQNQAF